MAVVGAGNVALDVLRTVLRGTGGALDQNTPAYQARQALAKSDVPEPVLAALSATRIQHVDLFARRGPAHAAFTNKELRELLQMPATALRPIDPLLLDQADAVIAAAGKAKLLDKADLRGRIRTLALLRQGSTLPYPPPAGQQGGRSWALHFFHQPHSLLGSSTTEGTTTGCAIPPAAVNQAVWNITQPEPTSSPEQQGDPRARVVPTGQQVTTSADFVVTSIGYQSESLVPAADDHAGNSAASVSEGTSTESFPFDQGRSVVPNTKGRVNGRPGEYVSGWLARGPTGVLGATMYGAYDTADLILADWMQGIRLNSSTPELPPPGLPPSLDQPVQKVISAQDWTRIDQAELERGAQLGKAREKFLSTFQLPTSLLFGFKGSSRS